MADLLHITCDFTFISKVGCSAIDYLLSSVFLLKHNIISDFHISKDLLNADHLPIDFRINFEGHVDHHNITS